MMNIVIHKKIAVLCDVNVRGTSYLIVEIYVALEISIDVKYLQRNKTSHLGLTKKLGTCVDMYFFMPEMLRNNSCWETIVPKESRDAGRTGRVQLGKINHYNSMSTASALDDTVIKC